MAWHLRARFVRVPYWGACMSTCFRRRGSGSGEGPGAPACMPTAAAGSGGVDLGCSRACSLWRLLVASAPHAFGESTVVVQPSVMWHFGADEVASGNFVFL